jgi:hypothetical protein
VPERFPGYALQAIAIDGPPGSLLGNRQSEPGRSRIVSMNQNGPEAISESPVLLENLTVVTPAQ